MANQIAVHISGSLANIANVLVPDIYGPENPSRGVSKGGVDMLRPLRTCIHRHFTLMPSEYTKVY